jgi:hypothetical protein
MSALTSNSTVMGCLPKLSILDQGGTELGGVIGNCVAGDIFLEPVTLPSTGTYTLMFNPAGTSTGQITLNLYTVVDITGNITPNGPAMNATITTPGQNVRLTFSGSANQQATVHVTNNSRGLVTVKLLKSDSTSLASSTSSASSFNLTTATLPVADTYTVLVDPNAANIGNMDVSVTSP